MRQTPPPLTHVTASLVHPAASHARRRPWSGVAATAAVALMAGAGLARHPWWTCLLLLVVAPVLEEVVFRAGLQDWLLRRRIQARASTVVTAMAFALMHGLTRSWLLATWVFVPALVLGALYAHKRSLAPVVVLHSAMNLVWLWAAPAWTGLSSTTSS